MWIFGGELKLLYPNAEVLAAKRGTVRPLK